MKSIYRCTSTYQGDRCKLSRDHFRDTADHPFHAGNFTAWDDNAVQGKAPGAVMSHKRNRSANNALRMLTAPTGTVYGLQREAVKADLGKLVEFYGGPKCQNS